MTFNRGKKTGTGKSIETVQAWLRTAAATNKLSFSHTVSPSSDRKRQIIALKMSRVHFDSWRLTNVRDESLLQD